MISLLFIIASGPFQHNYEYHHRPTPQAIEATYIDVDTANTLYNSSPDFMPQADKYPENPFFKKPATRAPPTIGWVIPQESSKEAQLKELKKMMEQYIDNKIRETAASTNQDDQIKQLREELLAHVDQQINQVSSLQTAKFGKVNNSVGLLSKKMDNVQQEVERLWESLGKEQVSSTTSTQMPRLFEPRFNNQSLV